ncbi:MAG: hypothetical protein K0R25_349 [Rickettsiaceae bacterium]|jgi:hypothetical protein|nr:hypothetical protein [Rickettsiaceae bacterium]
MVKKFTYTCDFGSNQYPVTLYIGNPAKGSHPLGFQSRWLAEKKGGMIPKALMDALAKLVKISTEQKVSFEELCEYVVKEVQGNKKIQDRSKENLKASKVQSQSTERTQNKSV